jgi:hypothetical protein
MIDADTSHSRGLQQHGAFQCAEHLGAMAGRLRRDPQAPTRREPHRSLNIFGAGRLDDCGRALVN